MQVEKTNNIRPNVLVVDDETSNLIAMRILLEELPVTILEAKSGEHALEIASRVELALILLDVQMPDMDGFEVTRLLRNNKRTKEIPIIFVTAISKENKYVERGHELGAVDYLFKPINPNVLKSKVMVFVTYYVNNQRMIELVSDLDATKASLEDSNKKLNQLARVDIVTGLPNRLEFNDHMSATIKESKDNNKLFAVLYLDLDDFKNINDTYGHEKGDILLKEVSERILSVVRPGELYHLGATDTLVSRLGGDEFAIILCDINDPSDAGKVSNRIIKSVNEPIPLGTGTGHVGISIGIACFPLAGDTSKVLQNHADSAMYRAKQRGKNHYQYYSDKLNKNYDRKLVLELGLRQALKKNQLYLMYQPVLTTDGRKVIGCEVLCQWDHPELGVIFSDEFIPIAESQGLTSEISEWVYNHALLEFDPYTDLVIDDFKIYINLSAKQLVGEKFFRFTELLNTYHTLSPSHIVFELTETGFISNPKEFESNLEKISELGYGISVDDFGAEYSSLVRLKELPIESIKIDNTFISKAIEDDNAATIAYAIIELAHNLSLESFANGVETDKQLQFVKNCSCTGVQGNIFCKALPIKKLVDYILHINHSQ